jgi:hypothetical protein
LPLEQQEEELQQVVQLEQGQQVLQLGQQVLQMAEEQEELVHPQVVGLGALGVQEEVLG